MNFLKLSCTLTVLALANPAFAAVYCVTTPAQFQAALTEAASNGEHDTIRVHQGTYLLTQELSYTSIEQRDLTISGGWFSFPTPCAVQLANASTTLLDGQGVSGGLRITSQAHPPGNFSVSNLSIRRTSDLGTVQTSGLSMGIVSTTVPSNLDIHNVIVRESSSILKHSGIRLFGPMNARVRNTLIANNTGGGVAGIEAVNVLSGSVYLQHVTIAGNQGTGNDYAGVVKQGAANLTVENSIIWGNSSANAGGNCPLEVTNADRLRFVLVTGVCGQQSGSNIGVQFQNPRFIDADYRIGSNSPGFNIGMNPPTQPLIIRDLDNNDRVIGPKPDLGAYESTQLFADGFE